MTIYTLYFTKHNDPCTNETKHLQRVYVTQVGTLPVTESTPITTTTESQQPTSSTVPLTTTTGQKATVYTSSTIKSTPITATVTPTMPSSVAFVNICLVSFAQLILQSLHKNE